MSGKKVKKKKLQSHRFEDAIKDYARTNSAYTDENKKELKRQEEALFGKLPLKPPKKL